MTQLTTKALLFLALCAGPLLLKAQNVGINTDGSSPDASAALDIKSSDKGMLVPRMTANQRSSITNPATGLLVFQTDPAPGFCYYNGFSWINLTSGSIITANGYSSNYGLTTTFAGNDASGSSNGTGASARFWGLSGLTKDASGNFYMTETSNQLIRKMNAAGTVSSVAGSPGQASNSDGIGTNAFFNYPADLATDASGNLYVADNGNNCIRKITPAGAVTTLAGNPIIPGDDDGIGSNALFNGPIGIAVTASGDIYVSDYNNQKIRKINPAGIVTSFAGTGSPGFADGTGAAAAFFHPIGLTLDASGNLYVADADNHRIRKITPSGIVTTFAGSGIPGAADGTLATATFNTPWGLTFDLAGNLYVSDYNNYNIRKISPSGIVSTLAGNGTNGGADGQGKAAFFTGPKGLTIDGIGNLYVADGTKIRKIVIN